MNPEMQKEIMKDNERLARENDFLKTEKSHWIRQYRSAIWGLLGIKETINRIYNETVQEIDSYGPNLDHPQFQRIWRLGCAYTAEAFCNKCGKNHCQTYLEAHGEKALGPHDANNNGEGEAPS